MKSKNIDRHELSKLATRFRGGTKDFDESNRHGRRFIAKVERLLRMKLEKDDIELIHNKSRFLK